MAGTKLFSFYMQTWACKNIITSSWEGLQRNRGVQSSVKREKHLLHKQEWKMNVGKDVNESPSLEILLYEGPWWGSRYNSPPPGLNQWEMARKQFLNLPKVDTGKWNTALSAQISGLVCSLNSFLAQKLKQPCKRSINDPHCHQLP